MNTITELATLTASEARVLIHHYGVQIQNDSWKAPSVLNEHLRRLVGALQCLEKILKAEREAEAQTYSDEVPF